MEMRFEPDEVSAAVRRMMMMKPATEVTFYAQGMEEGDTYVIAKRNGQLVVEKGAILTRWATTDWISVKDRLPERMSMLPCSVRVLISTIMGVVSAQYDFEYDMWVDFFNHKHSPFSKPNYYDESMRVTHWMPLPQPPKEESDE